MKNEGDAIEVITQDSDYIDVRETLGEHDLQWQTAEVTMIPQTMVTLEGKQAEQMLKLMDKLEDNDDVQNVYANFDISDEEIDKIMG